MTGTERRRHVRVKPTPELEARAVLLGDGLIRESLDVVDLSVSGLSVSSPALRGTPPGQRMKLELKLAGKDVLVVDVVARWGAGESIGVELAEPPPETSRVIGRFIAELLERGGAG